jgi:hypothetical protein
MPIGQTQFPIHAEDLVRFPRGTQGVGEIATFTDREGVDLDLPVQPAPLGLELVFRDGTIRYLVRDGGGRLPLIDRNNVTYFLTTRPG